MNISIQQWLSGERDYDIGLDLFQKYNGSSVLLKVFQKGNNAFTQEQLAIELENMLHPPDETIVPVPLQEKSSRNTSGIIEEKVVPGAEAPQLYSSKSGEVPEYPAELIQMIRERNKLYRSRDYMKSSLVYSDQETRRRYCLKIMEHTYRIDAIWKAETHFKATGGELIDFEDKSVFKVEQMDLTKAIANARSNISKHRKKGNEELLEKWKNKLQELLRKQEKLNPHAV